MITLILVLLTRIRLSRLAFIASKVHRTFSKEYTPKDEAILIYVRLSFFGFP